MKKIYAALILFTFFNFVYNLDEEDYDGTKNILRQLEEVFKGVRHIMDWAEANFEIKPYIEANKFILEMQIQSATKQYEKLKSDIEQKISQFSNLLESKFNSTNLQNRNSTKRPETSLTKDETQDITKLYLNLYNWLGENRTTSANAMVKAISQTYLLKAALKNKNVTSVEKALLDILNTLSKNDEPGRRMMQNVENSEDLLHQVPGHEKVYKENTTDEIQKLSKIDDVINFKQSNENRTLLQPGQQKEEISKFSETNESARRLLQNEEVQERRDENHKVPGDEKNYKNETARRNMQNVKNSDEDEEIDDEFFHQVPGHDKIYRENITDEIEKFSKIYGETRNLKQSDENRTFHHQSSGQQNEELPGRVRIKNYKNETARRDMQNDKSSVEDEEIDDVFYHQVPGHNKVYRENITDEIEKFSKIDDEKINFKQSDENRTLHNQSSGEQKDLITKFSKTIASARRLLENEQKSQQADENEKFYHQVPGHEKVYKEEIIDEIAKFSKNYYDKSNDTGEVIANLENNRRSVQNSDHSIKESVSADSNRQNIYTRIQQKNDSQGMSFIPNRKSDRINITVEPKFDDKIIADNSKINETIRNYLYKEYLIRNAGTTEPNEKILNTSETISKSTADDIGLTTEPFKAQTNIAMLVKYGEDGAQNHQILDEDKIFIEKIDDLLRKNADKGSSTTATFDEAEYYHQLPVNDRINRDTVDDVTSKYIETNERSYNKPDEAIKNHKISDHDRILKKKLDEFIGMHTNTVGKGYTTKPTINNVDKLDQAINFHQISDLSKIIKEKVDDLIKKYSENKAKNDSKADTIKKSIYEPDEIIHFQQTPETNSIINEKEDDFIKKYSENQAKNDITTDASKKNMYEPDEIIHFQQSPVSNKIFNVKEDDFIKKYSENQAKNDITNDASKKSMYRPDEIIHFQQTPISNKLFNEKVDDKLIKYSVVMTTTDESTTVPDIDDKAYIRKLEDYIKSLNNNNQNRIRLEQTEEIFSTTSLPDEIPQLHKQSINETSYERKILDILDADLDELLGEDYFANYDEDQEDGADETTDVPSKDNEYRKLDDHEVITKPFIHDKNETFFVEIDINDDNKEAQKSDEDDDYYIIIPGRKYLEKKLNNTLVKKENHIPGPTKSYEPKRRVRLQKGGRKYNEKTDDQMKSSVHDDENQIDATTESDKAEFFHQIPGHEKIYNRHFIDDMTRPSVYNSNWKKAMRYSKIEMFKKNDDNRSNDRQRRVSNYRRLRNNRI